VSPAPGTTASSAPGRDGWTWAGLAVVAAAAAVLSFDALRQLAEGCGLGRLGWLLPVAIDAAAVVATRVWLSGHAGVRPARYARALALAALGLSVAGNAAQHFMTAYQLAPAWWLVVAVSAVPPVMLGAVAHLAALLSADRPGAAEGTAADEAAGDESAGAEQLTAQAEVGPKPENPVSVVAGVGQYGASGTPSVEADRPGTDRLGGDSRAGAPAPRMYPELPADEGVSPRPAPAEAPPVAGRPGGMHGGLSVVPGAPADARVLRLVQLLRGGERLTGRSAARELGVSERTGRRLLRDAEQHLTRRAGLRETAPS
jgi:hypothetical protein